MWDDATLRARIASSSRRTRFSGASPDEDEIAVYEAAVEGIPRDRDALVLGMTPELRQMAGRRFDQLTSVDMSDAAIDLFADWVDPEVPESIVCDDWLGFLEVHPTTFSAIFGDGIFGNLPDATMCTEMLKLIAGALRPDGCFATRMALVPERLRPGQWTFGELLERHRAGEIDDSELGLTARLLGHREIAFDETSFVLDNPTVNAEIDRAAVAGEISPAELEVLRCFSFAGRNFLPHQRWWEQALDDAGMDFRLHRLDGKLWHEYYPVYECRPR